MKTALPETLKKLLTVNGISARKLSKETGISISTLSDVMNGRQISLKNLQLISKHFKVSLDYLVNGTDKMHVTSLEEFDFEDLFEGIVKIKISKLKENKSKNIKGSKL